MKRFALLMVMLVGLSMTAFAADVPQIDVFGGFSFLRVGSTDGSPTFTPLGWQASAVANATKKLGIVADFGGQYKNGGFTYETLFGPRFSKQTGKTTVYGHALYGFLVSGGNGGKSTNFAMGYGGGLDVHAGKVRVKAVQVDWISVKNSGIASGWSRNNIRFGFGVVIPIWCRQSRLCVG